MYVYDIYIKKESSLETSDYVYIVAGLQTTFWLVCVCVYCGVNFDMTLIQTLADNYSKESVDQ